MQNLRYSRYTKLLFGLADCALLAGIFLSANTAGNNFSEKTLLILFVILLFWLIASGNTKIYEISRLTTFTKFIEKLFWQLALFCLGAYLLIRISSNPALSTQLNSSLFIFCIALILYRIVAFLILKWLRYNGYNYRNIMFWARGSNSETLKEILLKRKDYGFRIFDFDGQSDFSMLSEFWKKNAIHTMYIPLKVANSAEFNEDLKNLAETSKVKISILPDILEDDFSTYHITYAETQPILEKRHYPLEIGVNFALKRAFDIIFSALFLIFIGCWLFPIIALIIKLDSKGKAFFKQKRYGLRDAVFTCYKFRTMTENEDCNRSTTKPNDKRITTVGRFLRKTSLDELPQFINVLLGDMSIVGPRPHMIYIDDHYRQRINRYSIRNTVLPGITGLAQIKGLRGDYGDMKIEMRKRILADAFYVKNWSFSLDAVIILKTVILLIKGDKKAY